MGFLQAVPLPMRRWVAMVKAPSYMVPSYGRFEMISAETDVLLLCTIVDMVRLPKSASDNIAIKTRPVQGMRGCNGERDVVSASCRYLCSG
jgi:hypothetical protein